MHHASKGKWPSQPLFHKRIQQRVRYTNDLKEQRKMEEKRRRKEKKREKKIFAERSRAQSSGHKVESTAGQQGQKGLMRRGSLGRGRVAWESVAAGGRQMPGRPEPSSSHARGGREGGKRGRMERRREGRKERKRKRGREGRREKKEDGRE